MACNSTPGIAKEMLVIIFLETTEVKLLIKIAFKGIANISLAGYY